MPNTRSRSKTGNDADAMLQQSNANENYEGDAKDAIPDQEVRRVDNVDDGGVYRQGQEQTDTRSITMPQEYLTRLLTEMQANSQQMLERALSAAHRAPASVTVRPPGGGNFIDCKLSFSGGEEMVESAVDAFISAVQTYKDCAEISDENALRGLPMLLTGVAAVWWHGVKGTTTTWEDALQGLRNAFGKRKPAFYIFRELFRKEQSVSEKTDLFVCKCRAKLADLPYKLPENVELDIVYGLLVHRLREKIPRDDIRSFSDLLNRVRSVEANILEAQNRDSNRSFSTRGKERMNCEVTGASAGTERTSELNQSIHSQSVQSQSQSLVVNKDSNKKKRFCSYCKLFGHSKELCEKLKNKTQVTSESDVKKEHDFSCFGCGTPNVIRANCPKCKSKEDAASAGSSSAAFYAVSMEEAATPARHADHSDVGKYRPHTTHSTLHTSPLQGHSARRPVLNIEICGVQGRALIDTAAKKSIAGHTLYKVLQDSGESFQSSSLNIKYANGVVSSESVLLSNVNVNLQGYSIPTSFVILPDANQNETLLGMDFISSAGLVIDFHSNKWHFTNDPCTSYQLHYEPEVLPISSCDIKPQLETLREDEGMLLTEEQKVKLTEILNNHTDRFKIGGEATPYAEHRITLSDPNVQPISVPPYRLPQPKKEALKRELDKMLENDVIEECESPWAAPVVMVPKKDGSYRICIDFRKLNALTVPDHYPLPRIDDLLHNTGKFKYITVLDLRSGYFQVPVYPDDRDKTAFITPFGVYRFKRMAMGLRNSGATFQRLVDRLRNSLPGLTMYAYLDDIVLLSESFPKFLEDLDALLTKMGQFKLQINREKSRFACESVKYLGHVLSADGIQPDPEKVKAVSEMKEPKNSKHLMSFIQTCSWFRKFIPNFSNIAKPLTTLLKKNQIWVWGPAQSQAFNSLKEKLITAPVLRQVDYSMPFILRVDASGYALGAVLLQGNGSHDERPVEYASRLLSPAEQNYSTTEREALAVVWALDKFRGYVEGSEIIVATDHQPLKWILSLKTPTGRLARWALKIQAYNLKIEYQPGKKNVVADGLSRPPCDSLTHDICSVCSVSVDLPKSDPTVVRNAQVADPEIYKIIKDFEDNNQSSISLWTDRGYYMSQGILYHCNAEEESEEPQLVVPMSMRDEIMKEMHDAPTAGHLGVERTYHRISQRFYFPGMRKFVADYLKKCPQCQRYKPSNLKPAGLIQTPIPTQRMEVIAMDLFGPLPTGKNGERWIFLVEDLATKWVELFPLVSATSEVCAKILIEEVFLRYGLPRRVVSDNGVQFVSEVMQKAMFTLGVKQNLIPLYHAESNPAERKNRDMKTQLAILVEGNHSNWPAALPSIRFSMNSAITQSTGQTPSYLMFGREMRSPIEATHDFRAIVQTENFVPQITPYLLKLNKDLTDAQDKILSQQAHSKKYADQKRRLNENFVPGDLVLLKTHVLSNLKKGIAGKLAPRRDGPYEILKEVSPTTYVLCRPNKKEDIVGKYHASDLTKFYERPGETRQEPVIPQRRRGRPRKGLGQPMSGGAIMA